MVLDNNETRKTSLKGRKIELIKRMTDKIRNFNGYVSNLRNSKSPKFSNANADLKSRIRRLNEIVTSVSAPLPLANECVDIGLKASANMKSVDLCCGLNMIMSSIILEITCLMDKR